MPGGGGTGRRTGPKSQSCGSPYVPATTPKTSTTSYLSLLSDTNPSSSVQGLFMLFCISLSQKGAKKRQRWGCQPDWQPRPTSSLALQPPGETEAFPMPANHGLRNPHDRMARHRSALVGPDSTSDGFLAEHRLHATSRTARGFFAAMRSSVRAAPEGKRRPCSHSCRVRTETPSSRANCLWERPVFSRIVDTDGTLMIRPCSPRLISRIPSSISNPISRFALGIDFFLDLLQNMARDVFGNVFRIEREHPNLALPDPSVIDDPHAPAFSTARALPSKLSDPARAGDHVTCVGLLDKHLLQLRVFFIAQILGNQFRKESCFDEAIHGTNIRQ